MYIYAGKGGVGKSTIAAATAIAKAKSDKKVLAIDYDGGKALSRVLQLGTIVPNIFQKTGINNLTISGVQTLGDKRSRQDSLNYDDYIKQFPDQYGLVAFNDMIQEFFGITTDIYTLDKYITLVSLLDKAKVEGIDEIVLDIEPTMGLQRLIQSSDNIARSLENLNKQGRVKMQMIGAARPDIKNFIAGDYVSNSKKYMKSFDYAQESLSKAIFSIVSIPEPEPLSQAIEDVLPLIQGIQGSIENIILNNVGRLDKNIEQESINKAQSIASDTQCNFLQIAHNKDMFGNNTDRITILEIIGKEIFKNK